jgi:hypothetical protein
MARNDIVLNEIRQMEPSSIARSFSLPAGYGFHAALNRMQVEAHRSAPSNSNLG